MRLRGRETALILTLLAAGCVALLLSVLHAHPASAAPTRQAVDIRWGFYVTYNPNSLQSLQANASSLNYVSPWYYNVNAAGQVTGSDQAAASAVIRGAGARSLPMVKNTPQYNDFTAIFTDTATQDAIVSRIDSIVAANGYDGVTVDFEGLNGSDRPLLTAFMGRLYAKLHPKGKLVAIAVAAKVKDNTDGWSGSYDYAALANVTDYILVMAYDYHYATGDPGPIAPMPRLRLSADYAVSKVPPSKLIWGVGVYGYDWTTGPDGKSLGHADYRTYSEAAALSALPNAQSGYDEDSQAPYVRYTANGATHEMWYENGRSFAAKLDLIAQYNMAGFGIWRLGQEDPAIWGLFTGAGDSTGTSGKVPTKTPTPRKAAATPKPTNTPKPTSTPLPPTATPIPQPPAACKAIAPFTATPTHIYFQPTGHSLGGVFLKYWQQHGGLAVFGYPLTEEFAEKSPTNGKTYKVQYFERNRFEYHPENQPPNDVQLGLLGVQALGNRTFPLATDFEPGPYTIYFPQVQHTLSGVFLSYWQQNGSIAQLGYPISEPVLERSPIDGKTYTVQYLERARLEYHPENTGTAYEVLLGLLGLNVSPCNR